VTSWASWTGKVFSIALISTTTNPPTTISIRNPCIDPFVPIVDWQRDLPLKWDVTHLQLVSKTLLVNGFRKPPTQHTMDRKGSIDNVAGNQIVLRRGFSHLGDLALNWNSASAPDHHRMAQ
jgi:hypothetical protein